MNERLSLLNAEQPEAGGTLRSIAVPQGSGAAMRLRRLMAFTGPGVLVSVGYMDPGNWATSIAGGSRFGFQLLSVVLVSNLIAMLFQAAAVRLGVAGGFDLAQGCRMHFSRPVSLGLWGLCEVAIVACNLAELLGMAIGLKLLFGLPLLIGVVVTAVDAMLILALQRRGFRTLEAVVMSLVLTIGVCFIAQIYWLQPSVEAVFKGFVPSLEIISNRDMLYLAVGIVGATVMPHNLYLHSSIVQTRAHARTPKGVWQAIRYATADSTVSLGLALFVNASILIVAAGVFNRPGVGLVTELSDAYQLLSPLLGVGIASAVFGVALLASGLSSSVTGALAGQIVMEGFLKLKLSATKRALFTRAVAIVPAVIMTALYGDAGVGSLLVFSQVILSLQLPFAIVPLLLLTTRRRCLGDFAYRWPTAALLWAAAGVVIAMNVWLLQQFIVN